MGAVFSSRGLFTCDIGQTAPPPMVANMLHCINSLLKNETFTIGNESDLDVARQRPSWIRGVVITTANEKVGAAALTLDGLRMIRCRLALPLTHLASSRTLKVLASFPSTFGLENAAFTKVTMPSFTNATNDTIAGVEWFPALEELSLMRCVQVDSVTRLAASKSLKKQVWQHRTR